MSAKSTLLSRAQRVAVELEELAADVVVVGGTSPALYDLPATTSVRPTHDLDLVIRSTGPLDWHRFVGALEGRGFRASKTGPICRYEKGDLIVDIMTTALEPLGFTNRWYAEGFEHRMPAVGVDLQVLPPIYFVATKLEAYESRGQADPYSSHDLEDIFVVFRGLPDLLSEVAEGTGAVHADVRMRLGKVICRPDALDIVRAQLEPDAATQALGPRLLSTLRDACRTQP